MKIVVAPDSFKGSLTSVQAAQSIADGIHTVMPGAQVVQKPIADGGEGTTEALLIAADGKRIPLEAAGPLGKKISTAYAITKEKTAIIECAEIAGLTQVPEAMRNPDLTTSYGIGEAIIEAIDKNCTEIIIGLGGSAVNDGGLGMLQALGMRAFDANREHVGFFGKDLQHINSIDFSGLDSRLQDISIKVASDVDNPLCGKRGATYVYGPQKGVTPQQLEVYDRAMKSFGRLVENEIGKKWMQQPGAGAAGGLGFALLALGAELISGAKLVAEVSHVEEAIREADLVITGEGQSDEQTLYGKAPGYIAALAKQYDVPVVLLSGSLGGNLDALRVHFSGCFSITNKPLSLEECMENACELLTEQTKQVMNLLQVFRKK